jgi:predicted AAA+ superfamily ATPase
MIVYRKIYHQILRRFKEKAPLIQILIGPRQVGKTTALKQLVTQFAGSIYESADNPVPLDFHFIEEAWQRAMASPSKLLVIDEVQKIKNWSEAIKKLWDQNPRHIKLALAGSSALLIEKGLKETLAGRFELIRVEHWNFAEAKEILNLSLSDFIEFGCYPGAVEFLNDKTRWASYVRDAIIEPVIGRDILQLHPVDNPALLRQVFGLATVLGGQVASLNSLQGQLTQKGAIATIGHYLNLLSDAFLISTLPKYSGSLFTVKKSIPKIIVHDNALMRALERPVEAQISQQRLGRYFENTIGARFVEAGWLSSYWNERQNEVDFVVQGPGGEKWAIEVKCGAVDESDLKGLRKFCGCYPDFEPCLISLIGQKIKGVKSLAVEDVLSLTSR